ncbi:MAG: 50S ribosomal protein L17 [Dehalococcoidales bacterium]|nr:50S ribosomal protein L17 [Dehalococcoidales bacterium]
MKGRGLGRSGGHRKALFRNLVTDLLKHEKITTTEAKAKEVRSMAEKVITLGKKGGLHSYRQALTVVTDEHVAEKVFSDLAKRYEQRPGGYTRIVKMAPRVGDAAPAVKLELVE